MFLDISVLEGFAGKKPLNLNSWYIPELPVGLQVLILRGRSHLTPPHGDASPGGEQINT